RPAAHFTFPGTRSISSAFTPHRSDEDTSIVQTTGSFFTSRPITVTAMPGDSEIIRIALERARELGADVAGAVPAARLTDCPSAVADGYQGSTTDRGTYIVLGLYH